MSADWKKLENHVRQIASVIWSKPANAEHIHGVDFDAVIRISDEEIILIEITKNFSLDKIRSDIAKLQPIKGIFLTQSVLARTYIITVEAPTNSMIELANAAKIKLLTAEAFITEAFDFKTYKHLRSELAFGSAINPADGKPDTHDYIPVKYTNDSEKKEFDLASISQKLQKNEHIILLGDYGTGKSRCTKELFKIITELEQHKICLAINLREHWGSTTAVEIIAGHLTKIGMSASVDKTMHLLNKGEIILLLDGFDEVGSQTFGITNQNKRETIRREALKGIRELIQLSPAGIIITGRPHYFNSHKEMLECLGISPRDKQDFIIKCASEFSISQADEYLEKLDIKASTPDWFPKKPLMFMILSEIHKQDAQKILSSELGEIDFWGKFIDTICLREAKIHNSIDPTAVRSVLTELARKTRTDIRELGRITPKDATDAYEKATGHVPDEYGQLMLSRLCSLGRIESESPDRQFVDPYIVQLLYAECLSDDIANKNFEILNDHWRQPIKGIGLYFFAESLMTNDLLSEALTFLHRYPEPKNSQAAADTICALTLLEAEYDSLDFSGLTIKDSELEYLALGNIEIKNLKIRECILNSISFETCKITESSGFRIEDSQIQEITGMATTGVIPKWIVNSVIEKSETTSNSARIKTSKLPAAQKLFLSVIQKIFFQRGGGRKDTSLYKGGFGEPYDRKMIDKVLAILVNEGYVEKSKDGSGFIYNPKREYTPKMKAIKDQLSLSKDPLWLKIKELDS